MTQADSVPAAAAVDGQPSARPAFRPDIEGLRAVAVLAVVGYHAGVPGLAGGFVGVDVFFVISGFLITGLLWREAAASGTVRLRKFYGARARRLLPASAAVGVVTMIAAVLLLPPLPARTAIGDGIASALYVSNYRFILQGLEYSAHDVPKSPFLQYWSLGVEEQFYLVWPALIIGTAWLMARVRRRRRAQADSQADSRLRRAQAADSVRPYLIVLAAIAVGSLALSLIGMYWAPLVSFFSLPTRAWQLAFGGLVALTADRWRRSSPRVAAVAGWAGLAAIAASCLAFNDTTPYPGTAALVPTVGAALVVGAGCALPSGGCGRVLGQTPMRAIGRISYSWYLWHWPVLVFAPLLLGHPLGLAARLTAALLSAGLAVLTLRYLENPLRFAPRVRDSPRISLALGAAATAVAVGAGAVLLVAVPAPVGRGAPASEAVFAAPVVPAGSPRAAYDSAVDQVFAQVQAAVVAALAPRPVPANLAPPLAEAAAELGEVTRGACLRGAWQADQPDCASADVDSATTVALVGDSHAAMWAPAFRDLAEQRHWRLETFSKSACPLMDLPTRNEQLHREFTECYQWRTEVLDRLREHPPQLIVLSMLRSYTTDRGHSAGFDGYGPAWIDSLARLVPALRATGAPVLVLGGVPDPLTAVPACVSGHLGDATACAPLRSDAVNRAGIAAERAVTETGGGQYADLTELFCAPDRCPVIVGNTLVFLDANHLTTEYSQTLAPAMGALADRALATGK